uniref:Uncharacterized protein n=1 Tax=Glossina palpalis gambiensis TaxID=67801 RepID=A0A1B0C6N4_9MUSC
MLRTPSTLLPPPVKIYNATLHSNEHTDCCAVYLDFQTLKVQVLVTGVNYNKKTAKKQIE